MEEKLVEIKEHLRRIGYYNRLQAIVEWDMRVNIPRKAIESRVDITGFIGNEIYKLSTSPKNQEWINYFSDKLHRLSDQDRKMITNLKKSYERFTKIPEDFNKEYIMLCADSEAFWEVAVKENNYEGFKVYLDKIIKYSQKTAEYVGYTGNIYDFFLNDYEEGLTIDKLDVIFKELKDGIVSLLNRIQNSKTVIRDDFFNGEFDIKTQDEFGKYVLDKLGYDFAAGKLDLSVHPFTTSFGNKDVRITTNYDINDFRSGLYSNIHEGGHGIYDQNRSDDLEYTGLDDGASMGIHESQSRYYENILGRSLEFWKYFYPSLQEKFPKLKNISVDDFYKGINKVEPSLIRIEADELTYSLHIIIRYELERDLMNGVISVDELPEKWNAKYKEYLGLEPTSYSEGVMQDVHWGAALIGYFPSYALGNIYGAQFLKKMKSEISNYNKEIENGNFQVIKDWLVENIHKHGAIYSPTELVKKVTGEELQAKYFLEYLEEKYSKIYNLD